MKNPNWKKCILKGDSRDIIKRIPDNSIDFILTDPPYNLGKHSTGNIPLLGRSAMNNDIGEWDLVDFNPEEWADEFIRILKPTGNLFIFTSYNQLGRWYNCLDQRFDTSNFMIWHKTNPAPKIYKAGFLNSCEMIFTCWNKQHTWNFISQKEMHNFVESPICMRPERLSNPKHPAQKPVSILKKMIKIASNENDIIFDPFMGVGSIGVAALELERRFIGIELNADFFDAAKKRIDRMLNESGLLKSNNENSYKMSMENNASEVKESQLQSTTLQVKLDLFFNVNKNIKKQSKCIQKGLQPIIKWAGGKEKELKYILPNLPKFNRYFEPFVGGGAVFTAIEANEYYINDFSKELIDLYKLISISDQDFFRYVEDMDISWSNAKKFFDENLDLVDIYLNYRQGNITKDQLKSMINQFCNNNKESIINLIGDEFSSYPCVLHVEMIRNLFRKMTRMATLEKTKHLLSEEDLMKNIETAIKSSIYMNYRYMYNCDKIKKTNEVLHTALFFFIRNYSYSGMFRYNSKGQFNVPYGGIAYNNKLMSNKLSYYRSKSLLEHFAKTHIFNLDFEQFLRINKPTEGDFIFLDPPYDTEFNTYAQNDFTQEDQVRLARYMIYECRAKWMLIIKYTDFIYELYNKNGIYIKSFDKEYIVSFMNRNNKKATHLLITNYD